MPVVTDPFGTTAASDAGWPYRQATWLTFKLPDPTTYFQDNIGNPPNNIPASTTPSRGRVIRGMNQQGGRSPANIAPLYYIWKDMLFYEYYRRWGSQTGGIDITPTTGFRTANTILAYDLNRVRDAIQTNPPALGTAGFTDTRRVQTRASYIDFYGNTIYFPQAYGYTDGFGGVSVGTYIYASGLNSLIDKIIGANNVCVCNCNYCTCNCNYCSCNCNYACTCNCNYSDIRLKTNIEQVGIEHGLKVYTWSYLWDVSKRFFGVMAQDLLGTKYESALNVDSKGYYYVDYSQLPITFRKV